MSHDVTDGAFGRVTFSWPGLPGTSVLVPAQFYMFSWQILNSAFGETAATEAEAHVGKKKKKKTRLVYQKTGGSRAVEPLRKHVVIVW